MTNTLFVEPTYFLMTMKSIPPTDIDRYIADFPKDLQQLLEQVRATIRKAAPEAKEAIKYGIPTFTLQGNLVHFGAYKKHIGFYATPSGNAEFQ